MGLCHHMVVYSPAHERTPIQWGIPVSAHMGCIPASVAMSAQSLLRIASLPWPLRPAPCLMTTAEVQDQAAKAIGLILLLAGAPNLHARDRMKQICVIVNMYLDMLHTVAIDDLTTGECRSAAAVAPVDDAVMELTEAEYVQALMSDRGAEAAAAWVQRPVEDGRVCVKKVRGLDPNDGAIFCEDCSMWFNGALLYSEHLTGKKHRSSMKKKAACGPCIPPAPFPL